MTSRSRVLRCDGAAASGGGSSRARGRLPRTTIGPTDWSAEIGSDRPATDTGVGEAAPGPGCTAADGVCAEAAAGRSEEHTSELQSRGHLVCRHLLEKKKQQRINIGSSQTT